MPSKTRVTVLDSSVWCDTCFGKGGVGSDGEQDKDCCDDCLSTSSSTVAEVVSQRDAYRRCLKEIKEFVFEQAARAEGWRMEKLMNIFDSLGNRCRAILGEDNEAKTPEEKETG